MNKYYEILGIDSDASLKEIKDAYRDLIKVWHPDRFSHDPKLRAKASGKLKSINEAYEKILSELDNDNETTDAQSPRWTTTDLVDPSIFKSTPTREPLLPRKLWYLGLIIVGLSVLALIVVTQYVRRDDNHHVAIAASSPVHESSPSPTLTPTPSDSPSPKAEPSRDELDDLLDALPAAEKKPSPPIDLSSGLVESSPTPTSTPTTTPTPRAEIITESLVSASDYLIAGITKAEDTRRYRFRLQQKAQVKGGFSARGNIRVEIVGGYYSSGGAISADTIDLILESGTYELIVSARESVDSMCDLRLTTISKRWQSAAVAKRFTRLLAQYPHRNSDFQVCRSL